ncbi:MAG TPA: radical SAM protein [Ardenticatenaceae bacterium]
MDILLTHGYYLYEDPHELAVMRPYPPLGILYLSAHLKARGFDAQVWDSTFRSGEAFREFLARERPPVVGIYTNMMTRRNVLKMIRACKENGALVVLGGPEPANYAEEYLTRGADVVVIGEGELTLEELLPHLARFRAAKLGPIQGIAYRDDEDGKVVQTAPRPYIADLDAQPFPDRAAISIPDYIKVWRENHGQGAVSLITARGCAYKCTWCSHAVYGYTHRRRSPQNVVAEVEQILETYQPDLLWYADDVFTVHHRWLDSYADELKRRGIRIPFETISREDRLNEQVVRMLAEMGCYRIWVGAESGSQRILDAMKRRTDAKRVTEVVHLLQRYGIDAGMFIMLGYDGEELSDLQDTVDILKEASPNVFLTTVAYPIKNTPYYHQVADKVIARKAWEEGSDRDLTVAGRHSPRFYSYATRWMVNEVAWHKQLRSGERDLPRMAKSFVNAKIGRVGMMLSQREVEG